MTLSIFRYKRLFENNLGKEGIANMKKMKGKCKRTYKVWCPFIDKTWFTNTSTSVSGVKNRRSISFISLCPLRSSYSRIIPMQHLRQRLKSIHDASPFSQNLRTWWVVSQQESLELHILTLSIFAGVKHMRYDELRKGKGRAHASAWMCVCAREREREFFCKPSHFKFR
jgi:hypothetical protein